MNGHKEVQRKCASYTSDAASTIETDFIVSEIYIWVQIVFTLTIYRELCKLKLYRLFHQVELEG